VHSTLATVDLGDSTDKVLSRFAESLALPSGWPKLAKLRQEVKELVGDFGVEEAAGVSALFHSISRVVDASGVKIEKDRRSFWLKWKAKNWWKNYQERVLFATISAVTLYSMGAMSRK